MTLSALLKTIHSIPHQPSVEAFTFNNQLDLTVITSRIIVCSEPVNNQLPYRFYKNSINDVLEYLNHHHKDNWMIYNLQFEESKYQDCQVFGNIEHYPFPDHQPPPFTLLVKIVKSIESYLSANDKRVALIHCKAGKGRTGTVVCSYLMKHYNLSAEMANKLYSSKRMRFYEINEGVSIKSQKRYLKYFDYWNTHKSLIGGSVSKKIQITSVKINSGRLMSPSFDNLIVTIYEYYGNSMRKAYQLDKQSVVEKSENEIKYAVFAESSSGQPNCIGPDIRVTIGTDSGDNRTLMLMNWIRREYCSFWFHGYFEKALADTISGDSQTRSSHPTKRTVVVKYEECDGIRGLNIKPGMRLFDTIEVEYQ